MTTLQTLIDNIGTLSAETSETKSDILAYIVLKYGERTVIDITDVAMFGRMIDLLYKTKWLKLKTAIESNISLTEKVDTDKETKTTEIYGYDGSGTKDNVITTEHELHDELPDVFTEMSKSLDFYNKFSYYCIVIKDIVNEISLKVYE